MNGIELEYFFKNAGILLIFTLFLNNSMLQFLYSFLTDRQNNRNSFVLEQDKDNGGTAQKSSVLVDASIQTSLEKLMTEVMKETNSDENGNNGIETFFYYLSFLKPLNLLGMRKNPII